MNDIFPLVLSGLAGVILGALFFGGLWWTVRKGVASPHPALWFLGSLLFRTAIVLGGFYLLGQGDWKRLVICLLGFISARFLVVRLTRPPVAPKNSTPEDSHATNA